MSDILVQYKGKVKVVISNKYVACKPYKAVENKTSVFSDWELKNPLPELEIVFADKEGEYIAGANIYVRPFLDPPSWIKDVFTFNNQEVILVPKEQIVGYKFVQETKLPTPSPYTYIPHVEFPQQWPQSGQNISHTVWWTTTTGTGTGPVSSYGDAILKSLNDQNVTITITNIK